jgi:hypothetical protein
MATKLMITAVGRLIIKLRDFRPEK